MVNKVKIKFFDSNSYYFWARTKIQRTNEKFKI